MIPEIVTRKYAAMKNWILLFLGMLVFRVCIDLNYALLIAGTDTRYPAVNFDLLRYAVSHLWGIVLFAMIRHSEEKASTFLLYLVFLLQIVPISSIYGLWGAGSAYYHVLCLAFLLCELLVGCGPVRKNIQRNTLISNAVHTGYGLIIPFVLLMVFLGNGLPTLTALDMSQVYELRGSGAFRVGKYIQYLLVWTTAFFVPLFLARAIAGRSYLKALVLAAIQLLFYLYTGHKTYLFIIPLVIACSLWSRRKHFYKELFLCLCAGFAALSLLAILATYTDIVPGSLKDLVLRGNSYLCRRTMIVPAINKFVYFDYFSTHPKMGLGGVFPTWLISLDNPYATASYSYDISAIYYGMPEMNSNTGFLAEGFLRFGHPGTFLVLAIFAMILRQIDSLQNRLGYALTVSIFICPVYALADAYLLDQLLFGSWMPALLFMFFCQKRNRPSPRRFTWGCRRLVR